MFTAVETAPCDMLHVMGGFKLGSVHELPLLPNTGLPPLADVIGVECTEWTRVVSYAFAGADYLNGDCG